MPTLIRAAHVLTLDPSLGDIAGGEILIEGDRIKEVGKSLEIPPGAEVWDAGEGELFGQEISGRPLLFESFSRAFSRASLLAHMTLDPPGPRPFRASARLTVRDPSGPPV